jgi:hypothetical protein
MVNINMIVLRQVAGGLHPNPAAGTPQSVFL